MASLKDFYARLIRRLAVYEPGEGVLLRLPPNDNIELAVKRVRSGLTRAADATRNTDIVFAVSRASDYAVLVARK